MFKSCLFLFSISIFLGVPPLSFAQFESLIRSQLSVHWLPNLQDRSERVRYQARQAFFAFPEWGLPVLREAIRSTEIPERWQFVALLGVLGSQEDIPFLLEKMDNQAQITRIDVWEGSVERLYWKYRVPVSGKFLISQLYVKPLEVVPSAQGQSILRGSLHYKLANPTSAPKLLYPQIHFWRAKQTLPHYFRYHWVASGSTVDQKIPVELHYDSESPTIRVDFHLKEPGEDAPLVRYQTEIPLIARPSPSSSSPEIPLDLPQNPLSTD